MGQWRSLTNEEIYNAQRVIGAIYTSELADRLQALGYDIRRTDEKGNFEIAGITREQIEHFSQRRAEIEAALKAKGVDIDDASAQQKEDATLKTRARKVDVDHEALIGSWKERAKDIGIDFDAIQAKADAQRAQGGVVRADKLTGREAMSFAAAHLIEREAVVSKNDLMAAAIEHGAGRVSASEVKRAFDKLEKDGDLAVGDRVTIQYDKARSQVYEQGKEPARGSWRQGHADGARARADAALTFARERPKEKNMNRETLELLVLWGCALPRPTC